MEILLNPLEATGESMLRSFYEKAIAEAAFTTNYEANVFTPISQEQFEAIKEWVQAIAGQSSPISEEWLEQYEERSKGIKRKQANEAPVIAFDLPNGASIDEAIRNRRK